jgi:formiminotetrahydrofolate cyclodeaminase
MQEIKDQSIQFYLDQLASKQATPGGGSAAALMGAQAAALICMVCNLTLGKPKFAEVEAEIQTLLEEAEQQRTHITTLIKADIDVFNTLMSCYALPKQTETEKAHRSTQIQTALQAATQVPLECAYACASILKLSQLAAEKGNPSAVSDAGVAVMSAYSGLKSAALNVYINAASLKDRDFAEKKLTELQILIQNAEHEVHSTYALVKNRL